MSVICIGQSLMDVEPEKEQFEAIIKGHASTLRGEILKATQAIGGHVTATRKKVTTLEQECNHQFGVVRTHQETSKRNVAKLKAEQTGLRKTIKANHEREARWLPSADAAIKEIKGGRYTLMLKISK